MDQKDGYTFTVKGIEFEIRLGEGRLYVQNFKK